MQFLNFLITKVPTLTRSSYFPNCPLLPARGTHVCPLCHTRDNTLHLQLAHHVDYQLLACSFTQKKKKKHTHARTLPCPWISSDRVKAGCELQSGGLEDAPAASACWASACVNERMPLFSAASKAATMFLPLKAQRLHPPIRLKRRLCGASSRRWRWSSSPQPMSQQPAKAEPAPVSVVTHWWTSNKRNIPTCDVPGVTIWFRFWSSRWQQIWTRNTATASGSCAAGEAASQRGGSAQTRRLRPAETAHGRGGPGAEGRFHRVSEGNSERRA